ncbi:aerotaxis receptor [Agarivorans sp. OAG1]|uniref:Aerotaxis sensor receptor protein n=1 Tax=Agarivorans albus MKT 106 TaxID=1331007 RepID=R9PR96_AGAAL|nr:MULTISPECIES: PAS domain-containing methyl-accepting chemotaxis protein [Agarivorans]MPW28046.1 PAS domain-containing protein [Agarivorans sp. B2Z047]UQN44122.1 methyl-accepting chemotaxis protein [Agarivorans sp. B2Z047]BEU04492.1 aerotaxis receptor [Agarivorans sp. OAG1]GAD00651.1 aerotaxis sensor receptor protein [Agarivorans albus MKT 106]
MRNNQPITKQEQKFTSKEDLVSITDLQGKIKYVNDAFVAISGFSREELIGQDHNIVRHPDMPPAAFESLWGTVKSGNPWRGFVKNRCKNGDHYWVDAFVSPIVKQGQTVGYQSVRSEPTAAQVSDAEKLYAKMRNDSSIKIPKAPLFERTSISTINSIFSLVLLCFSLAIVFMADSSLLSGLAIGAAILQASYWFYSHQHVYKRIQLIQQHNRDLAAGDFTRPIAVDGNLEMLQALASIKIVQARYKAMFMQVSESVKTMINTADSLSATSNDVLESMRTQSSHTTQIATGMNQMSVTVDGVRENVQHTAETTQFLSKTVDEGDQVVADALVTMQQFTSEMASTTEKIKNLAQESQQISSITDTISSIAEQTNLLALNAAIEAARAGEQGRGFAVVADEVRNLAARSQEATKEIQTMLEHLSSGISSSASTIDHNNNSANQALEKVSLSREKFVQITEGVEQINQMSTQIATAASQQSVVANEMASSIESISAQASSTELEGEKLQNNATQINQNSLNLQIQIDELELAQKG